LNQDKKRDVLKNQDLLYKGISFDTIADIYEHLYERTVGGKASPIHMQALTEVQSVSREETGYKLTLYQYEQDEVKELKSDVVIMATGYA
ncbi:SidA/IucD/PvdA family monooxygenase, partial [Escherichia coli]|nr:SidA/IucD/PvdA family monooxygenase [Escherichia coli]